MRLQAGEIVGEYRVLEALGVGGAGQVFRVEHLVTKRQEAMKVLLAAGSASDEQLRRFDREIRLQAALHHPNIAPVYNAFYHGNCLCMVMELLEGETLEQKMEAGRLAFSDAVSIARQILAALAHAHSKGVIHRDVSAANIMISPGGAAKITDFGLAIDEQEVRLTQSGTPLGSCYYMAPEQVRGSGPIDARADIYSFGAVLFEMFCGRRLFLHTDAFSLMEAHVHESPRSLRSSDRSVSKALDAAILKALAKSPSDRYATAPAFLSALESAIAHPEGQRVSLAFAGGLAAVAVPLLLAVGLLWRESKQPPVAAATVTVTAVPVEEAPPALPPMRPAEEAMPVSHPVRPAASRVARRIRQVQTHAVFQLPERQVTHAEVVPPAAPVVRSNSAPTLPIGGLTTAAADLDAPKSRRERFFERTRVLNPFRLLK